LIEANETIGNGFFLFDGSFVDEILIIDLVLFLIKLLHCGYLTEVAMTRVLMSFKEDTEYLQINIFWVQCYKQNAFGFLVITSQYQF
jgi:hypothetical protein